MNLDLDPADLLVVEAEDDVLAFEERLLEVEFFLVVQAEDGLLHEAGEDFLEALPGVVSAVSKKYPRCSELPRSGDRQIDGRAGSE